MKKRWKELLEHIEKWIDRLMPFMLILLAILIGLEFTEFGHKHHDLILTIDYFIIAFFIIDLSFKWAHTRNVVKFVKLYWIDIIAVFPFYLVFRLYAIATEAILVGEQAQKLLHEAVLIRETRLLREAEYAAKFAKEGMFVRIFARGLRVLRARWYVTFWHMQDRSKKLKKH